MYVYIYMYQLCYGGDISHFKVCLEILTHAADIMEKTKYMSRGTRSIYALLLLAAYKHDLPSENS